MPRAFTPAETAAIQERLRDAATATFARKGVRATTVAELAAAAGISKGAFYGFYDSKEALFLTLLSEYELTEHAAIEAAIAADPEHGLDALLDSALRATLRNPLVPIAMSGEGLRLLAGRSAAEQEEFLARDVQLVERVLALLADAGLQVQAPLSVLTGLLRALVFVGWHRGEIGEELSDELNRWLRPVLRAAVLAPVAPAEGGPAEGGPAEDGTAEGGTR